MTEERPEVMVLGPRTPPFHGAAVVNDAMVEAFSARRCQVRAVDTSGHGHGARYHLSRVFAHLRAACDLVRRRRRLAAGGLYVSGAGGGGLWYQTAVAGWARLLGVRVMVHHHSYAYLHDRDAAMTWLWRLTRNGVHVALCDDMARRLVDSYGTGPRTLVCSNTAFVRRPTAARARAEAASGAGTGAGGQAAPADDALVVGHLSNLSDDKGLEDVIRAFVALAAGGAPVRLELAGPAADEKAQDALGRLLDGPFGHLVRWHGPLDRDAVWDFLATNDLFVFPSRYRNEAEPLVVLEALACSVPCVVTGVGCLATTLSGWPWVVTAGADLDAALDAIAKESRRPDGGVDRAGLHARAAEQRSRFGESGLEAIFESWDL